MILVIEHASDLQSVPQEPPHCSLEQALRNMDWPFPAQTAAAVMAPTRPQRRALTWPTRIAVAALAPVPVRPDVAEPLPMLEFAGAY